MNNDSQVRDPAIIAIVDDDDAFRAALKTLLRSSGYTIRTYSNALEFLDSNALAETQCLISDIHMPGMSGVEMHGQLVARGLSIPTIFVTGYPSAAPAPGADNPSLIACLAKPCTADTLLNCIETALCPRA